jgi:flagellar biosynthesis protein FlhG
MNIRSPYPYGSALPRKTIVEIIASGKGGVGKTWFAIHLAYLLAQKGERVLLFDGDLGLANIDIQLDLRPQRDLSGVVDGSYSLDEAIMAYQPGGFDVIPGRSGNASLNTLSRPQLLHLRTQLEYIATAYDRVLIDLGAGIGSTVQGLWAHPQGCYVVTTDEPTALTDAYAFLKVFHQKHQDTPMALIINQVPGHREGQRVYEGMEAICRKFLKCHVRCGGILRKDPHVHHSIRAQEPIFRRYPRSNVASDLRGVKVFELQDPPQRYYGHKNF